MHCPIGRCRPIGPSALHLTRTLTVILSLSPKFIILLARDVIYTSRAYVTMSVSVCLSVTEVHCGHGACREHSGCASQRS